VQTAPAYCPVVVTCLVALSVFPAFHLWTANSVSSQKHVVPGFLFAYLVDATSGFRAYRGDTVARSISTPCIPSRSGSSVQSGASVSTTTSSSWARGICAAS
jgi:hypothetical protein